MNGVVFYKGLSQFDKKPIVGIAVGLSSKSSNVKTGSLIQTYILVDNGVMPHENAAYGKADSTVCGNCPHRAGPNEKSGSCYVNLGQGPHAVYSHYLKGKYPSLAQSHKSLFTDRFLRLGSYGDPTAIPFDVWINITSWAKDHTGYTHQWRLCDQRFKNICMASCDSTLDYDTAKYMGWRTFRVKTNSQPVLKSEVKCPASPDSFPKRQCEDCMACNGTNRENDLRRDIVINAHGLKWRIEKFRKVISLL